MKWIASLFGWYLWWEVYELHIDSGPFPWRLIDTLPDEDMAYRKMLYVEADHKLNGTESYATMVRSVWKREKPGK